MKTLLLLTLVTTMSYSQTIQVPSPTKDDIFKVYAKLVGGKWETKGKWQSGAAYHQEIIVDIELTNTIFTVKTYDYIDSKQFNNAQRNYGIRAWDNKEQKMKFWEFDVFGGITTGEVRIDNNDIYHIYQYSDSSGEMTTLADAWIYVDDNSYIFKVCEFSDGKLGKEYLSSTYHRRLY